MITLHKFSDDFCEENYVLIAVHSGLEDYALAYALNRALKASLKRSETDLAQNVQITAPQTSSETRLTTDW